jgi:hypothetical protein
MMGCEKIWKNLLPNVWQKSPEVISHVSHKTFRKPAWSWFACLPVGREAHPTAFQCNLKIYPVDKPENHPLSF